MKSKLERITSCKKAQHINPAGHQIWRKFYLMLVSFLLVRTGWGFFLEQLFFPPPPRHTTEGMEDVGYGIFLFRKVSLLIEHIFV